MRTRYTPFHVLIEDIENSVKEGRLTEREAQELTANFQNMAVKVLTKRGQRMSRFFGDFYL
jgi:hypothetical protein